MEIVDQFEHAYRKKCFFNSSLAKLNFDNEFALLVVDNRSAGISGVGAWFRIRTSKQARLPEVGTPITSIKLWGDIIHNDESTFYLEHTVVLNASMVQ